MSSIVEIFSESQIQTLSQDAPTPLYFRLYSLLKDAILNGTIGTGIQMPTEQQLAETFGVSRITAKRAMDELAAENLVERRRGKGTHVTYQYKPGPVKAPLVGMLQEIESMARHSDVKVIDDGKYHTFKDAKTGRQYEYCVFTNHTFCSQDNGIAQHVLLSSSNAAGDVS